MECAQVAILLVAPLARAMELATHACKGYSFMTVSASQLFVLVEDVVYVTAQVKIVSDVDQVMSMSLSTKLFPTM